jgi:formyl-CoA transferase/CoA:oxalate CoA-transferase
VRVLDLSRVLAGPFATQVLGDLGADVIKVEQRGVGDPVRHLGPPFLGDTATYYLTTNRNRRSVVADLERDDDRAFIFSLAASADLLVENFLPHQRTVFGLDDLRRQVPELIWVSVTPAATGGPLAALPAFDLLAQARSGIMDVTGERGGQPLRVGVPISDLITGLYAAIGALAALHRRGRSGEGATVEAPLLESMVTGLINQAQALLVTGEPAKRMGNDHPSIAPYGPIPCADGPLMVAVGTERQYQSLVSVLGDDVLATDPRFATFATRAEHRPELAERLERCFTTRTRAEWMEILDAVAVPAAPINTVGEALSQEQLLASGLLVKSTYDGQPITLVGSPLRIDGSVLPLRREPPTLGQHDEEVRTAMGQP